MITNTEFKKILAENPVLILDGATGTNLQNMGLPVGTAPETWVLEKPDQIRALYTKFIMAGSDIILTCTFGGNRIRLAHAGLAEKAVLVNQTAVNLAKKATAGTNTIIAGSMGPTGEMMAPLGTLQEDEVYQIYQDQAKILIETGVDLLVIETQYDLTEALTAIRAVRDLSDIGLICSFSYDSGTRTMMGMRPQQAVEAINKTDAAAIGINCGKSLEKNLEVLETLKPLTEKALWFKPNAGAPEQQSDGSVHYHITPEDMGKEAKTWVKAGAKLIGGCCGTSPAHLAAIKNSVK